MIDNSARSGPSAPVTKLHESAKKLFRDGAKPAALRLVSATTTSTGVDIAAYQPAGPVQTGSYALDQ